MPKNNDAWGAFLARLREELTDEERDAIRRDGVDGIPARYHAEFDRAIGRNWFGTLTPRRRRRAA